MQWLGKAVTMRWDEATSDVIQPQKRSKRAKRIAEEVTQDMKVSEKLARKRKRLSWCSTHSGLTRQLLEPEQWPPPPVSLPQIMNRLMDRVQGRRPSKKIRQLRLHVWQQARRGNVPQVAQLSGPVRTRVPTPDETGNHELMLSDGTIWCQQCGLYTRKRQSRQFGVECTQVARASLAALREGRHPVRAFKFRRTTHAVAEVFARPAHTAECTVRQESMRFLGGYDSMSCICNPPSLGARCDNPPTRA